MREYKYFRIEEVATPEHRKTSIYDIVNKRGGYSLGKIKWYSPWRQYCFFPEFDTVWNDGCLRDILGFLTELRRR